MSSTFEKPPVESYEAKEKRTRALNASQIRRARVTGIVMLLLAAVVVVLILVLLGHVPRGF